MFKNLYQLRLLDFFELTAATAGALYVYQSDDWWNFEKLWVIAALSIAAIFTWIATRLAKTPIPGLFLATYTGALYGLSDLSPWMAIFGRLAVIETAIKLFPESTPAGGWQERCTTVAVVVVLMTVPALFFSCTWAAVWNLIQLVRKKYEAPKTLVNRGLITAQFLMALVFITGLSYYSLRPQIRFVRSIRINVHRPTMKPQSSQQSEADEMPIIVGWATSNARSTIFVIYSDMRLVEYDLLSGAVLQNSQLRSETGWSVRQRPEAPTDSLFDSRRKEHIDLFEWNANQILLCRQHTDTNQASVERANVSDGMATRLFFFDDYRVSSIKGISNNGEYAVIQNGNPDENGLVKLSVWNLRTLTRLREIEVKEVELDEKAPLIDNSGKKVQLKYACQSGPNTRFIKSRIRTVIGTSGDCTLPQMTNDGRYTSGPLMLHQEKSDNNLLAHYEGLAIHSVMHPTNANVVLFGTRKPMEYLENDFVPILESLLQSANSRQLTLFDTTTNHSQTSWFRTSRVRNTEPDSDSVKFTSNGKYMVVPDEEKSADLFHVFAMP